MAFLENAFKHGVSTTDPNAWVEVHFDLRGKECRFSVANSKLPASQEQTTAMVMGTGLPNVRHWLALSYPDRRELRVQDLPDRYLIDLHLFL